MSTEIATQAGGAVAVPVPPEYAGLLSSKEWLGRISQNAVNNEKVVEGTANGGDFNYVVSEDQQTVLGREFDAIVIADRPQALDFSKDTPVSYFDPQSAEFLDVKARADADKQNSKCLYGPCFLLYLPKVRKFATLFLTSWSAKKQFQNLYAARGKAVTVRAQIEKKGTHTWWKYVVVPCSMALEPPEQKDFDRWLADFKNPKAGPEKDTTATNDDR